MAKRTKKKVKNRSAAHRKWVGAKRKVRKKTKARAGNGTTRRRRKKLNKKK